MKNYLIICVIVLMGLWGCGSPNFTDVEKGKIDLVAHERAAIQKLINEARLNPEELIVFSELSEYKYTSGWFNIFIENGRVKALTLISSGLEQMDGLSPLTEIRDLELSYNQIKKLILAWLLFHFFPSVFPKYLFLVDK